MELQHFVKTYAYIIIQNMIKDNKVLKDFTLLELTRLLLDLLAIFNLNNYFIFTKLYMLLLLFLKYYKYYTNY